MEIRVDSGSSIVTIVNDPSTLVHYFDNKCHRKSQCI